MGSSESGERLSVGHDGATVWASGEIDMSTADRLHAVISERAAAHPDRILLDMAGVTFMDSLGLRALLAASERVPLQIVRASDFVSTMLYVCNLEDHFGI